MIEILDRRPLLIALAGPNGAGKSTFYNSHLKPRGLRFVNADQLSLELKVGAYRAAEIADAVRRDLLQRRESFIFETVFSDPVGDKIAFLKHAERSGYTVMLLFIGIDSAETSDERVAQRVAQGGHNVPRDKIASRYGRTMENLRRSLGELNNVGVYDNSDLRDPHRLVAFRKEGKDLQLFEPIPGWLAPLLPPK
jgi:predicted ABC-type ATPase